jgi:hypothetical protein
MANSGIVKSIEEKNLIHAHDLVEKTLYRKAGSLLEEKRKQIAAKYWPAQLTEAVEKDKSKEKAEKRKALKEKLKEKEKVKK